MAYYWRCISWNEHATMFRKSQARSGSLGLKIRQRLVDDWLPYKVRIKSFNSFADWTEKYNIHFIICWLRKNHWQSDMNIIVECIGRFLKISCFYLLFSSATVLLLLLTGQGRWFTSINNPLPFCVTQSKRRSKLPKTSRNLRQLSQRTSNYFETLPSLSQVEFGATQSACNIEK